MPVADFSQYAPRFLPEDYERLHLWLESLVEGRGEQEAYLYMQGFGKRCQLQVTTLEKAVAAQNAVQSADSVSYQPNAVGRMVRLIAYCYAV